MAVLPRMEVLSAVCLHFTSRQTAGRAQNSTRESKNSYSNLRVLIKKREREKMRERKRGRERERERDRKGE